MPEWSRVSLAPPFRSVTVPLAGRGMVAGRALISTDPGRRLTELWRDARLMLAGLGGMALAQALLICWGMGRGLAPLEQMRRSVERLTGGELTARVGTMAPPNLRLWPNALTGWQRP